MAGATSLVQLILKKWGGAAGCPSFLTFPEGFPENLKKGLRRLAHILVVPRRYWLRLLGSNMYTTDL